MAVVRWCVHGSLWNNSIGPEGGAAIAGALRHVPSLTQLEYVVGGWASHEAAGCVLGEGVMVGGWAAGVFRRADVAWLRVFGKGTMQCSARRVVYFECVCGMGLRTCLAWAKMCRYWGMSVR